MRVACLSDTHGHLPEVPECDLLLIAGDFVPPMSEIAIPNWLLDTFDPWLRDLPVGEVVGICGNHEFVGQTAMGRDILQELPWSYLEDTEASVDGLLIYGSPWTPTFFNWAFMKDEADLVSVYAEIPEGLDILLTHGPPRGILDQTYPPSGVHAGSVSLAWRLAQLEDPPFLHVFGHIHEGRGQLISNNTVHVNAAYVNALYDARSEIELVVL